MKSCKDCMGYEYDLCTTYYDDEDMKEYTDGDIRSVCMRFKDKSKFIEKPFNIRDRIYIITRYSYSSQYEIIECIVNKMRLKDGNTVTFSCSGLYANRNYYTSGNFKTSSIGKTVFITREEAEKKLEELNGQI